MSADNDWVEYKRVVLENLETLKENDRILLEKMAAMHSDVAVVKVKAGFWGFLAGTVGALAGMFAKGKLGS
jgi:hypothetical protein